MYYRHVKGMPQPSNLLLLTRADARYAADVLNAKDPDYIYQAEPRFLGYEGADFGVNQYLKNEFGNKGKFVGWIDDNTLQDICKDRPIVLQSESFG